MIHFDRSGHFGRNFPLFLGIFHWDEPTKRVPFTAEPEIPEILTKRKAPFVKIVVPSTALLYPAYKNNNQTHGGLSRVCATGMYRSNGHVEFPKFQTQMFFFFDSKRP